jgi:putative acetyltransferase
MSLKVQKGSPRLPGATALLNASHAYLSSLYPPEDNYYLSIEALCAPDIAFFVATLNGEVTGCAALKNCEGYGEIKSMFVDPEARGSGTGAALMVALETEARSLGLGVLRLETGDTLDAAHRLYARHGYVICGPFGDYVDGPHSVFMEKYL